MYKIADNIVSPLGWDTAANLEAVRTDHHALRRYEHAMDLPEPFVAALIDRDALASEATIASIDTEQWTPFEQLALLSATRALAQTTIDVASERTLFILSTTKGNVDLLDRRNQGRWPASRVRIGDTATLIAQHLGFTTQPIVVSNACTSGLCAQITAWRAIHSGRYDTVVVTGAEVQSRFIISGFQSFKALSGQPCRPFDAHRDGLNAGEAAATVIFSKTPTDAGQWQAVKGAICNDANHISGPSRTGEGSYRALRVVTEGIDPASIALLSVHGTATPYNDEMEAIAINRAGLSDVPINSLKGYYGHTMGAAGVLETIINLHALDHGIVLGTAGFSEMGVSQPVNISATVREARPGAMIKLLSGFGGCNAAMRYEKGGVA